MGLTWFILAAYGLTYLVVHASIFNKIRPAKEWLGGFGKVFHCTLCFGTWAGIILFSINRWTELFTFEYTFANFLICGCVGAGTSYFLSTIVDDGGLKVNKS
jgi:hypothetical protein